VSRVLLFFALSSALFANELIKVKEYWLQKDEQKKILVKYASSEKLLAFRWTLYKNDVLVLFSSYDQIVSQHMLQLNYTNQSVRIELKSRGAYERVVPYILIQFNKFDFEKYRAKISIWLYDKHHEVLLRYLKKQEV